MHEFPNTVFYLHFSFLIEKIARGKKETPCELVGTPLWVDRFFGSTLKVPSKQANYFDLFYVQYIQRQVIPY